MTTRSRGLIVLPLLLVVAPRPVEVELHLRDVGGREPADLEVDEDQGFEAPVEEDEIDVIVLAADGEPLGPPEDTKLVRKLLKRSEKSLGKACLADAADLFGDSPKRSAKRLASKARGDLAAPHEEAKAA